MAREVAPDVDCFTLPDGSCVAEPCRLHDPRDDGEAALRREVASAVADEPWFP